MVLTWHKLILTVISIAISTSVAFFLKNELEAYLDYRKLKNKLQTVAGKRSTILLGREKYTIESFDSRGVLLNGDLDSVFIPIKQVMQMSMYLPNKTYDQDLLKKEEALDRKLREKMLKTMDVVIEESMPKMFAQIKRGLISEMESDDTQMSVAIGVKITKLLEEEGISLRRGPALKKKG